MVNTQYNSQSCTWKLFCFQQVSINRKVPLVSEEAFSEGFLLVFSFFGICRVWSVEFRMCGCSISELGDMNVWGYYSATTKMSGIVSVWAFSSLWSAMQQDKYKEARLLVLALFIQTTYIHGPEINRLFLLFWEKSCVLKLPKFEYHVLCTLHFLGCLCTTKTTSEGIPKWRAIAKVL